MCGRFAPQLPPELLRRIFAVPGDIPNTAPSRNVAPTHTVPVVRLDTTTKLRRLDVLTWAWCPASR
jgi:putative SOS response-associated peptidase YedK